MMIVLYTKRTRAGIDLLCGKREPTIADLATNYVVVYEQPEAYQLGPDDVFRIFNGADLRTPNPLEANEGQLNVMDLNTHTSMSVGDIVQLDDTVYICQDVGWRKICWKGGE